MTRVYRFLFFVLLLNATLSEPAFSRNPSWDYSTMFSFRGRPVGATITGEVGYGIPIWQSKPEDEKSVLFGFIRPYFRQSVTGVWYQTDGGVQVSPIAPLVFYLGQAYNFRLTRAAAFDCDALTCKGVLRRSYFEIKGGLKIGSVFGLLSAQQTLLKVKRGSAPLADEMSVLPGVSDKDKLLTYSAVIGYDLPGSYDPVTFFQFARMRGTQSIQTHAVAGVQHKRDLWTYALTAGFFRSAVKKPGFTLMGLVRWEGQAKISLF